MQRKDDMMETYNPDILKAFHTLWDAFPGPVRLIDKSHKIIAANNIAQEKGFIPDKCCATVGEPCSHRGCKSALMLKTGLAQIDRPSIDRVRGWIPLAGYPDIYVHFTLMLPEENNQ